LLQLNHYRYERLDGSTSASARNASVDRFRRDSFKSFVMLLSSRAGGLGLNLTAVDTAIILDSDWNPQNDQNWADKRALNVLEYLVIDTARTPLRGDEILRHF